MSWFPPDPSLEGRAVGAIAEEQGVDPSDLVLDLSLESSLVARFRMAVLNFDDDAVEPLLTDAHTMLGLSDAGAHASQLCDSCFSTHLLSHWVRDRKALSLEEAVRKLTSEPAAVFGITDRGTLASGRPADVVVFDADTVGCSDLRRIADQPAGAERLVADATGVEAVIVNGTIVRRAGVDAVAVRRTAPGPAAPQRCRMTSPTAAGTAPKTRWGDREGRRRDILDVARSQMAAGGYLALNMREIARGAGVSPGTLYQYFSTKEEIFATLYAEAITAHNERIAPICAAADDLEQFLVDVASAYLDLYAAYGRYFTMWHAVIDSGRDESSFPRELGRALRDATLEQADILRTTLRRLAGTRSRRSRPVDDPVAVTFLWAVLNGLGDHVTSERRHLTPFGRDELVAFAARTLAAGLTSGPTAAA